LSLGRLLAFHTFLQLPTLDQCVDDLQHLEKRRKGTRLELISFRRADAEWLLETTTAGGFFVPD